MFWNSATSVTSWAWTWTPEKRINGQSYPAFLADYLADFFTLNVVA
jgi:hypothetical protein